MGPPESRARARRDDAVEGSSREFTSYCVRQQLKLQDSVSGCASDGRLLQV